MVQLPFFFDGWRARMYKKTAGGASYTLCRLVHSGALRRSALRRAGRKRMTEMRAGTTGRPTDGLTTGDALGAAQAHTVSPLPFTDTIIWARRKNVYRRKDQRIAKYDRKNHQKRRNRQTGGGEPPHLAASGQKNSACTRNQPQGGENRTQTANSP